MNTPAAITGSYTDLKYIKTRSCVQLVIEIPIERAHEITDAFGWPQPGEEIPVAVARLRNVDVSTIPAETTTSPDMMVDAKPAKPRFHELPRSRQKEKLCGVGAFQDFMLIRDCPEAKWTDDEDRYRAADRWVKLHCNITSGKELDTPGPAQDKWDALRAEFDMHENRIAEVRG